MEKNESVENTLNLPCHLQKGEEIINLKYKELQEERQWGNKAIAKTDSEKPNHFK